MKRPSYCSTESKESEAYSDFEDNLKDDFEKDNNNNFVDDFLDLNCDHSSSVKYRNVGNVHVVLRVYDEDDAGRLVSSSAAAQYAELEDRIVYENGMRLVWMDWNGRRFRVPYQNENKL